MLHFSSVLCTKNKYDGKVRDTDILSYCRALCLGQKQLGKGRERGKGRGGGESMWTNIRRPLFRPLVIDPADHLSVGKIVIYQLISRVSKSWENYQEMSGVLLRLKTE